MAHFQQFEFVRLCSEAFPAYFRNTRVVEIGSWNVNGSVRTLFTQCNYTGVDVSVGPGVDVVCSGAAFAGDSDSYDVAISCECFEHNRDWKGTFANMVRMLRPGGLCIVTTALPGRHEHGTPRSDNSLSLTVRDGDPYYRNLDKSDFYRSGVLGRFDCYMLERNFMMPDIYFAGFKRRGYESPEYDLAITQLARQSRRISISGSRDGQRSVAASRLTGLRRYVMAKLLGEKVFHDLSMWYGDMRAWCRARKS